MRQRILASLLLVVLAAWVFWGWRTFWFLTDDAYIAFRYVRNLVDGHGLVWNPAPFRPVEGYTSFLWTVLLAGVWKITGIEPPAAANVLGLWTGYLTLLVLLLAMRRMRPGLAGGRADGGWPLLALALLGLLTNRHFFTWLSSGLETGLFNLCVAAWMYYSLWPDGERDTRHTLKLTTAVAALALTRPDGLLFMAATAAQIGVVGLMRRRLLPLLRGAWPLALPLLHLAFRRGYYGEWLPNTYYAKFTAPWPQAGLRYLGSFLLENGMWLWLLLAGLWLLSATVRLVREGALVTLLDNPRLGAAIAVLTAVAHVAYFTFIIGGDHFEYRVYSCWLPWLFLSCAWLAHRLTTRAATASIVVAAVVLFSWPIQWLHFFASQGRTTRHETHVMWIPLAHAVPAPASRVVAVWDGWQRWLIQRSVGARHQEHKAFVWFVYDFLDGSEGLPDPRWDEHPVVAESCVGIVGWELPHVAVIDKLGLNDHVVARSRVGGDAPHRMAHERVPPPGYVECFDPNVVIDAGGVHHRPRSLPAERVVACERSFARRTDPAPRHGSARAAFH